jgi:hypothetical protein
MISNYDYHLVALAMGIHDVSGASEVDAHTIQMQLLVAMDREL